ncbi:hypothetical protein LNK15_04940 [Jeotgalicoccus huakuii]|uniref:aggregation-promoting factor C-terminal-like domain-containing protein n=1 Tax=Jeotgalicoccus TaxID=227979 RepID=UPI000421B96C|nr:MULTISPECIES: hypothetical protein [Jeotgalicoccus]MCK1976398.1 hypothetical protein [Jeotgalicoccus huakuii]QQD84424.1 hypothetical protein JEM45_07200 [Jeotgalicoccus sp. ATCC 8456]
MKKTILATSLALGLGVTGVVADQDVDASSINKEELAQTVQNNPAELNAAPIHEGAYDYNFTLNNVNYDFTSDGTNYSWAYSANGNATATNYTNETVEAPKVEEVQEVEQTNNTNYNTQNQQAAPAVEEVEVQETQQQVSEPAAPAPTQSTSSSNGSTKSQFLAAGGTEAMWNNIVLPESSGNPNAVSPNGYQGLGQTKESWGTGSVADQTAGMLDYAERRYGSIDNAIQFRNANNWW